MTLFTKKHLTGIDLKECINKASPAIIIALQEMAVGDFAGQFGTLKGLNKQENVSSTCVTSLEDSDGRTMLEVLVIEILVIMSNLNAMRSTRQKEQLNVRL